MVPRLAATSTAFVDESKSGPYILAATAVSSGEIGSVRREVNRICTQLGRSRLHFNKLNDRDRRFVLGALAQLGPITHLYIAREKDHKLARAKCLRALIEDAIASSARGVFLERDASVEAADRRLIWEVLHSGQTNHQLRYGHIEPRSEPCLWVSDAIAWCEQAGDAWRIRAAPLVHSRTRL